MLLTMFIKKNRIYVVDMNCILFIMHVASWKRVPFSGGSWRQFNCVLSFPRRVRIVS
jgi:hypothetical protein